MLITLLIFFILSIALIFSILYNCPHINTKNMQTLLKLLLIASATLCGMLFLTHASETAEPLTACLVGLIMLLIALAASLTLKK